MGWFKKNTPKDTEETAPAPVRNPDNVFMFRIVAVGYVLYTVFKTIKLYIAGGEDAPALWMLCLSTVILGGGAIFLGIISYKSWKKAKAQQQAEAEAEAEAALAEEMADTCDESEESEMTQ